MGQSNTFPNDKNTLLNFFPAVSSPLKRKNAAVGPKMVESNVTAESSSDCSEGEGNSNGEMGDVGGGRQGGETEMKSLVAVDPESGVIEDGGSRVNSGVSSSPKTVRLRRLTESSMDEDSTNNDVADTRLTIGGKQKRAANAETAADEGRDNKKTRCDDSTRNPAATPNESDTPLDTTAANSNHPSPPPPSSPAPKRAATTDLTTDLTTVDPPQATPPPPRLLRLLAGPLSLGLTAVASPQPALPQLSLHLRTALLHPSAPSRIHPLRKGTILGRNQHRSHPLKPRLSIPSSSLGISRTQITVLSVIPQAPPAQYPPFDSDLALLYRIQRASPSLRIRANIGVIRIHRPVVNEAHLLSPSVNMTWAQRNKRRNPQFTWTDGPLRMGEAVRLLVGDTVVLRDPRNNDEYLFRVVPVVGERGATEVINLCSFGSTEQGGSHDGDEERRKRRRVDTSMDAGKEIVCIDDDVVSPTTMGTSTHIDLTMSEATTEVVAAAGGGRGRKNGSRGRGNRNTRTQTNTTTNARVGTNRQRGRTNQNNNNNEDDDDGSEEGYTAPSTGNRRPSSRGKQIVVVVKDGCAVHPTAKALQPRIEKNSIVAQQQQQRTDVGSSRIRTRRRQGQQTLINIFPNPVVRSPEQTLVESPDPLRNKIGKPVAVEQQSSLNRKKSPEVAAAATKLTDTKNIETPNVTQPTETEAPLKPNIKLEDTSNSSNTAATINTPNKKSTMQKPIAVEKPVVGEQFQVKFIIKDCTGHNRDTWYIGRVVDTETVPGTNGDDDRYKIMVRYDDDISYQEYYPSPDVRKILPKSSSSPDDGLVYAMDSYTGAPVVAYDSNPKSLVIGDLVQCRTMDGKDGDFWLQGRVENVHKGGKMFDVRYFNQFNLERNIPIAKGNVNLLERGSSLSGKTGNWLKGAVIEREIDGISRRGTPNVCRGPIIDVGIAFDDDDDDDDESSSEEQAATEESLLSEPPLLPLSDQSSIMQCKIGFSKKEPDILPYNEVVERLFAYKRKNEPTFTRAPIRYWPSNLQTRYRSKLPISEVVSRTKKTKVSAKVTTTPSTSPPSTKKTKSSGRLATKTPPSTSTKTKRQRAANHSSTSVAHKTPTKEKVRKTQRNILNQKNKETDPPISEAIHHRRASSSKNQEPDIPLSETIRNHTKISPRSHNQNDKLEDISNLKSSNVSQRRSRVKEPQHKPDVKEPQSRSKATEPQRKSDCKEPQRRSQRKRPSRGTQVKPSTPPEPNLEDMLNIRICEPSLPVSLTQTTTDDQNTPQPLQHADILHDFMDCLDDEEERCNGNQLNSTMGNAMWRALCSAEPHVGFNLLMLIGSILNTTPNEAFAQNLMEFVYYGSKKDGICYHDPNRTEMVGIYLHCMINKLYDEPNYKMLPKIAPSSWADIEQILSLPISQTSENSVNCNADITRSKARRLGQELHLSSKSLSFISKLLWKETQRKKSESYATIRSQIMSYPLCQAIMGNTIRASLTKTVQITSKSWVRHGYWLHGFINEGRYICKSSDEQRCAVEAKCSLNNLGEIICFLSWLYCAEEKIEFAADECCSLIVGAIESEITYDNLNLKCDEKESTKEKYVERIKLYFLLSLDTEFSRPLQLKMKRMLNLSTDISAFLQTPSTSSVPTVTPISEGSFTPIKSPMRDTHKADV